MSVPANRPPIRGTYNLRPNCPNHQHSETFVLRPARSIANNRLVAALPSSDRQRLLARCEPVELHFADVLSHPGETVSHVFFPTDSFISLIKPMGRHAGLEVGLVGDEGMWGVSLMLGVNTAPLRALVHREGGAWRMESAEFSHELRRNAAVQQRLSRYLFVMLSQFAQAGACTRFHLLEARLARRLLMIRDRAHADEFPVTHELLAEALGMRRAGVSRAAHALQKLKLIRYSRGTLTILDANGLEAIACACYAADKESYARVLS